LKVNHIRERMRSLIFQGKLLEGQRLPSDRELASDFGVSAPTVNKAMAALELDGLLDRTVGRGTFVRKGIGTGTVAVVFDWRYIAGGVPFYDALMQALMAEVLQHRMQPQFVIGRGATAQEFTKSLHPASPIWRQVTGVITVGGLTDFEDELAKLGKPVVTLSAWCLGRYCVLFDYRELMRLSCTHLAERGYGDIGLISRGDGLPDPDPSGVLKGFEETVLALGLVAKPQWRMFQAVGAEGGRAAMQKLWSLGDRPRAIVVDDDNTAVGVGQAIVELGIRCPEDLAVITHGTIGVVLDHPVAFTQCCFDLHGMCEAAWALLNRLKGGAYDMPGVTTVTPRVVTGRTT